MSQRYSNEVQSSENDIQSEPINYSQIVFNNDQKFGEEWFSKPSDDIFKPCNIYTKTPYPDTKETAYKDITTIYAPHSIPRGRTKRVDEEKFRSPNVCIAKNEIGGSVSCNCNRHFTLNVPDLRKSVL
jgi:hypothetical protein